MKYITIIRAFLLIVTLSLAGCASAPSESELARKTTEKALAALATENDTGWSETVDGLRARLRVLPSDQSSSPFCRVFIEFQNVADVMGQKRIRFAVDGEYTTLTLKVTDKNDKALPHANEPYDGGSPNWETIALPFHGMIRFQISFPGAGYMPVYKVMINVGDSNVWVVPQDGSTYYLSGTLLIRPKESDNSTTDWSGTLDLPKTEIPRVPGDVAPGDKIATGLLITRLGEQMLAVSTNDETAGLVEDAADEAAKSLAAINDPRVIPFFCQAVDSKSYSLKFAAIDALAKFDSDDAFAGLQAGMRTKGSDFDSASATRPELLDESAQNIRGAAAFALSESKNPAAQAFLLEQRHDTSPGVRLTVVQKLGTMPPSEALPILREMSDDKDVRVSSEVKRYIDLLSKTL